MCLGLYLQPQVNIFKSISNYLDFGEHLLIKVNKISRILKNILIFNQKFNFLELHLINVQKHLRSTKHWLETYMVMTSHIKHCLLQDDRGTFAIMLTTQDKGTTWEVDLTL